MLLYNIASCIWLNATIFKPVRNYFTHLSQTISLKPLLFLMLFSMLLFHSPLKKKENSQEQNSY